MPTKPASLLLALLPPTSMLGACASTPRSEPIPVLAEAHRCPAFPLAPPALLKPPSKIDFLHPTD